MPYTTVTRTKDGAGAIKYARGNGKGHNNKERRNEYITGINMAPDSCVSFEEQMQPFWDRARESHTNQVIRYVISFSPKELDPNNPADVLKGHEIGCEIMREIAPGHQVAVFTQTDGVGGKIHIHGIANDVNMETYKRIPSINTHQHHFAQISDRICSQYFELDTGHSMAEEKEPHAVRGAKKKNREIREANAKEIEEAQKENREPVLKKEKYIWKEDLKQRIQRAAEGAEDEQDFFERLKAERVRLIPDNEGNYRRHATKTQPVHYTYELIVEEKDLEGLDGKIPTRTRAKSFKLGDNYQPEGVAKRFKNKGKAKDVSPQEDRPEEKPIQTEIRTVKEIIKPAEIQETPADFIEVLEEEQEEMAGIVELAGTVETEPKPKVETKPIQTAPKKPINRGRQAEDRLASILAGVAKAEAEKYLDEPQF